jgi:phospholipid transport system substrate-binding protein
VKRFSLVLIACLLPLSVSAASPNDIVAEASHLLQQSLEIRKAELTVDKEALYVLVDEILLPRFDRKLAAQLVLGKHWRSADDAEKTRFIEAFYATLVHRYADGVLAFDLSRLQILPYRGDETKNRTKVRTKVRLDDGTVVPVDYSLIKRSVGWQFYDVVIEGVSFVRNFRAEIDSEIRATNLEAVISRLESKAGNNAQK